MCFIFGQIFAIIIFTIFAFIVVNIRIGWRKIWKYDKLLNKY